jgi:hypothetical protein
MSLFYNVSDVRYLEFPNSDSESEFRNLRPNSETLPKNERSETQHRKYMKLTLCDKKQEYWSVIKNKNTGL